MLLKFLNFFLNCFGNYHLILLKIQQKLKFYFFNIFLAKSNFSTLINYSTCVEPAMNLRYIGLWTLKMKCTQYGLYEHVAFKNVREILFTEVDGTNNNFRLGFERKIIKIRLWGRLKAPDCKPKPSIHLPLKVCTGMISVHPFALVQSNLHLSHVAKENFTFVTI